ncbi:MAG: Mpo1-like protein [Methylococcales bacterium]
MRFFDELRQQRWDDHRYYHHSRINQFLHLVSASSFLASYVLVFINPVIATLIGWLAAMGFRQIGHFFFEPRCFDAIYRVTHEYKESIKVGYNLKRKIVLLSIWAMAPVMLYYSPSFFGVFEAHDDLSSFIQNMGMCWLALGIGALVFRTVHLFFIMGIQSGFVWATKILTDPFHDIKIYYKSPYYILKKEWYDDMTDWYEAAPVVKQT